jgi:hypothetical protein
VIAFILSSLIRVITSSDTGKSQISTGGQALVNSSANRAVKMTVRGQIVADENFRSYQIQVSPNQRKFIIYQGYLNHPINDVSLYNNTSAYEQFVYALNHAGLMNNDELTGNSNDVRGVCATGYLYEFETLKDSKTVKKLWSTSCSDSRGSLGRSVSGFVKLFNLQIPDAQSTIGDIWQ